MTLMKLSMLVLTLGGVVKRVLYGTHNIIMEYFSFRLYAPYKNEFKAGIRLNLLTIKFFSTCLHFSKTNVVLKVTYGIIDGEW